MTKEALKMALEALEDLGMKHFESTGEVLYKETFIAIKETLAQPEQEYHAVNAVHKGQQCYVKTQPKEPEQEPLAFEKTVCPFCTSEWVTAEQHDRNVDRVERKPLSDEEIYDMYNEPRSDAEMLEFARAIEAAHGIKGEV